MTIYVSSGGYGGSPAFMSARKLADAGIEAVELSGGAYCDGLIDRLAELTPRLSFQLHNYFPPPAQPFVLNLGSLDARTGELSVAHVRGAIQSCAVLGADRYSFHAGFLLDPRVDELGKRIQSRALFDRNLCIETFVGRVHALARFAELHDVRLMIENNVLSARNAKEFGANPLLMCEPEECKAIMSQMPGNVGLLVDVAHLKVSARSLGFEPERMFEHCGDWIRGYHLSDNDGLEDSNMPFDEHAWFWSHLKRDVGYYSIEVYGMDASDMPRLVEVCDTALHAAS